MSAEESLQAIRAQVQQCRACSLHAGRTLAVPGEGPAESQIMFIGEGPGFHEDQQGKPFVGQAGKFLDELLGCAGLKRSEVFITNVVKCRPPNNRDPQPDELSACEQYLDAQIEAISEAEGESRAVQAAEKAIANPLLDEISLNGAKGVLINVTGGHDLTLFELDEAANIIREKVDPDANIIVGSTLDASMEGLKAQKVLL